jgi:hypothetical protein
MPDTIPPAHIVLTTTTTPEEVARLDDLPRRPEFSLQHPPV